MLRQNLEAKFDLSKEENKSGAPEGIRTPDRSVRSRLLYPAELRVRVFEIIEWRTRRDSNP